MADNIPVHNRISVRVRNLIEDIVTGSDNGTIASTDGKIFSANVLNQRINEAYAWVVDQLVQLLSLDVAKYSLADSITQQAVAIASGGVSVNKDYLYATEFLVSQQPYEQILKTNLDADYDKYLDFAFAVYGQKIYVYARSGGNLNVQNSGNGVLHYLKADRLDSTGADVAPNTTPDTTINNRWVQCVTLYAAYRLCQDKAAAEWQEKAKIFFEQAMSYLPRPAQVQSQ